MKTSTKKSIKPTDTKPWNYAPVLTERVEATTQSLLRVAKSMSESPDKSLDHAALVQALGNLASMHILLNGLRGQEAAS